MTKTKLTIYPHTNTGAGIQSGEDEKGQKSSYLEGKFFKLVWGFVLLAAAVLGVGGGGGNVV